MPHLWQAWHFTQISDGVPGSQASKCHLSQTHTTVYTYIEHSWLSHIDQQRWIAKFWRLYGNVTGLRVWNLLKTNVVGRLTHLYEYLEPPLLKLTWAGVDWDKRERGSTLVRGTNNPVTQGTLNYSGISIDFPALSTDKDFIRKILRRFPVYRILGQLTLIVV